MFLYRPSDVIPLNWRSIAGAAEYRSLGECYWGCLELSLTLMPFTTVMFSFSSDSKETRRVLLFAPIVTPARHWCTCATTQRSSVLYGRWIISLRTNTDDRGPHANAPVRPPHFLSMTQRKTWRGDWTQVLLRLCIAEFDWPCEFVASRCEDVFLIHSHQQNLSQLAYRTTILRIKCLISTYFKTRRVNFGTLLQFGR